VSGPTGWRRDPFGLHEWRYFVDGKPTSQVGDAGLLYTDEPPQEEPPPTSVAPQLSPAASLTDGQTVPTLRPSKPAIFAQSTSLFSIRAFTVGPPAGLLFGLYQFAITG